MLTAVLMLLLASVVVSGGHIASTARTASVRAWLDGASGRAAEWLLSRFGSRPAAPEPAALCAGLIAELRAGAAPAAAVLAVEESRRLIPRTRAAAELGEPAAAGLAADATAAATAGSPDAAVLAAMAACWRVSADSGAGLADGLERVAGLAVAARRVAEDLRAETAAPRATARILAGLPLLGLLFGELLGAQPVQWLATTPAGWLCLVLGSGFMLIGWYWSSRIVAAAGPRVLADRG